MFSQHARQSHSSPANFQRLSVRGERPARHFSTPLPGLASIRCQYHKAAQRLSPQPQLKGKDADGGAFIMCAFEDSLFVDVFSGGASTLLLSSILYITSY